MRAIFHICHDLQARSASLASMGRTPTRLITPQPPHHTVSIPPHTYIPIHGYIQCTLPQPLHAVSQPASPQGDLVQHVGLLNSQNMGQLFCHELHLPVTAQVGQMHTDHVALCFCHALHLCTAPATRKATLVWLTGQQATQCCVHTPHSHPSCTHARRHAT
jgi:hypothetical protein